MPPLYVFYAICLLHAHGDVTQAVGTLEQGLCLAAPEGYLRTFLDEGEPMASLLLTAAARGIAPEYVRRLLAAFRDETTDSRRPSVKAASLLVEPLGERELEVLRLIDAGLSNREIAEELCVAVSTVKKHINHIYDKLDAGSRTQALAKAREARIL
jgi:LuxR family transcriptional regulator, maltose regulon positive regulatory protein